MMRILPGAAAKPPGRTSRVRQERLARARMAFDAAYRQLHARACSLVRKYEREWTEDIVHQGFLEMWEACYKNGDIPSESPKALLYRILRRRLIDHIREQRTANARDFDLDHIGEVSDRIANQLDSRRVADGRLLQARIEYLLAAMPAKTAEAYRLSTELHRDPEAIAMELGVTKETARWHVWEAKKRLRKALINDGYVAGDADGEGGGTA